jgi:hypothetical protein
VVKHGRFRSRVKKKFPKLTEEQWGRLERLGQLVQEWNSKVGQDPHTHTRFR